LEDGEHCGETDRDGGPAPPLLPADLPAGQTVEHEEPPGDERCRHVDPIRDRSGTGVVDHDEPLDPREDDAAHQQKNGGHEERIADLHRAAIGAIVRAPCVRDGEDDERNEKHDPESQMDQEHDHVEPVLVRLAGGRLERSDREQVHRVDDEQREKGEDRIENNRQSRTDDRVVATTHEKRTGASASRAR